MFGKDASTPLVFLISRRVSHPKEQRALFCATGLDALIKVACGPEIGKQACTRVMMIWEWSKC